MPLDKLTIRLDSSTRAALQERADSTAVTLGSYVGAVLDEHLEGQPLTVEARPRGLANVSTAKKHRLAARARRAKETKERDRG